MKKAILIILCLIVLVACKNSGKSNRPINTSTVQQTITKKIRSDTSYTGGSFQNIRHLSDQLKLNPIDNGFDSLQIRVWFAHSMGLIKHLVVIERNANTWSGRLYNMRVDYVDSVDYDILEGYYKKPVKPVSGWRPLIDSLNYLKIRDLSDSSETGADGMNYSVEIVTPSTYTYYDFWEPESTKDKNWQAANMVRIGALLEREFGFNALK